MNVIFSNSTSDARKIASTYDALGYKTKIVVSDNHNFSKFMLTIIVTK